MLQSGSATFTLAARLPAGAYTMLVTGKNGEVLGRSAVVKY